MAGFRSKAARDLVAAVTEAGGTVERAGKGRPVSPPSRSRTGLRLGGES